jgi:RNA binding exosome subunit
MSSKPPIAYIDIRVFAHATENPQKVQTATQNLFSPELSETLIFQKQPAWDTTETPSFSSQPN